MVDMPIHTRIGFISSRIMQHRLMRIYLSVADSAYA